MAAVGCGAVAVLLRRRRVGMAAVVFAALWCALFVVVVGEEVAWGQRVFGTSVPALERVNDQGDVSLHNVGPGLALSNLGILGHLPGRRPQRPRGPVAGGHRRGWRVRPEFLPPPYVLPWFAMAAAFTAVRLVVAVAAGPGGQVQRGGRAHRGPRRRHHVPQAGPGDLAPSCC